jgi:hypothetical protein
MDINHLRFMVSGFQVRYSRLRLLKYMVEDEKFLRWGVFLLWPHVKMEVSMETRVHNEDVYVLKHSFLEFSFVNKL